MPRRLASKLIVALSVIVVIAEVISVSVEINNYEKHLLSSLTTSADQLSRSITAATWQAMLADHRTNAYDLMNTIAEKQGIERIRMFNRDGTLMFSTEPGEKVRVSQRNEVCAPCHSANKSREPLITLDSRARARVYHADGRRTLAMITPIYNEPSCSTAACHAHPSNVNVLGVLDLTVDASRLEDDMQSMRTRTALTTLFELAVICGFLVFFTRFFVENPIRRLIAGTKAVSEMQLDEPVSVKSSEELEQLANSFNIMRERLKDAVTENTEFTQKLESKVTERTAQLRAAQQKLIKADRLASLGQLAASVAHEINNPVSGVLNLSMLMKRILKDDGIPEGRIPEFRRYLEQVSSETTRVGRIVSDLLSFSRRAKPQTTDADLNAIIRNTLSLVSHKLQLMNVQVIQQLDPLLPTIRGDASQIQQVVMNLILNGAEAIKGAGTVTVKTGVAPDSDTVLLEVSDTGTGMSPELAAKIFDPFFTTKEDGKGVGLGLAVVYGIIEGHGGDIEVISAVGEGSTFRVVLPLRPPQNGSETPQRGT